MDTILAAESTLTDRYQTTVPETVRQALNLGKRDKIRYAILPDGSVRISRGGDTTGEDPVMMRFLEFLAADIESHPERVRVFDEGLRKRVQKLVGDIEVDLDAPLSPEDE